MIGPRGRLCSPGSRHLAQSKGLTVLCMHRVPGSSVIQLSYSFTALSSSFQASIPIWEKIYTFLLIHNIKV